MMNTDALKKLINAIEGNWKIDECRIKLANGVVIALEDEDTAVKLPQRKLKIVRLDSMKLKDADPETEVL